MEYRNELERYRGAIRETWTRAARARAEAEQREPRPGDLFVFAESAEMGVLWVLAETDPPKRCRLVAADGLAFKGSRDVAAPADAACGALCLRCGVVVELPLAALESARPRGQLDPETLERLHAKLAAVQTGRAVGSELERQTDHELDYRDWVDDTLGRAQSALLRAHQLVKTAPVPFKARPRRRSAVRANLFSHPWRLAASILVAVSLGLLGLVVGQRREIAELEALSPMPKIHGNLPFISLRAAGTRGETKLLEVPSTAAWVVVFLALDDPGAFQEYRLEIRDEKERQIGSVGGLTRVGVAEIRVALSAQILGNGEYRLLLYGRHDGEEILTADFAMKIRMR